MKLDFRTIFNRAGAKFLVCEKPFAVIAPNHIQLNDYYSLDDLRQIIKAAEKADYCKRLDAESEADNG